MALDTTGLRHDIPALLAGFRISLVAGGLRTR